MGEKTRNNKQETDVAFALSIVLTNILLLAVMGGIVWLIHLAVSSNGVLYTFLRGGILR